MTIKTDNPAAVGAHTFELSGCGVAPFRFVGMFVDRGPKQLGNGMTVGTEGQAMGTCKHCGMGIAECCVIEDANGKRFTVGTTCVNKTGDAGLLRAYKNSPEYRAIQGQKRDALAARKLVELRALLGRDDVRALLDAQPHPQQWRADAGETLLGSVEWMVENAGDAGRHRTLKLIKAEMAKVAE